VKTTALTTQCSKRIATLAEPKKTPVGYKDGYTLPVPVPEKALRARSTTRIAQLAEPRFNMATFLSANTNNERK
jgi:hypothetical protein